MPRELPLLQDLESVERASALRRFATRRLSPGERLFSEGQAGNDLVYVQEGELDVRKDGVSVGGIGPGELMGELALVGNTPRTATLIAKTPLELRILDRDGYEALQASAHPVAARIEKMALLQQLTRLRHVGDRISSMAEGEDEPMPGPSARFFGAVAALFGAGGPLSLSAVDPRPCLSQLFREASEPVLGELQKHFSSRAFGPGTFLCTEGARAKEMYVLDQGTVEVLISTQEERVQRLATLEPGAAFGLLGLADGRPRLSSCVAREQVVVHILHEPSWKALLDDPMPVGSAFRRALLRIASEQLARTNPLLASLRNTVDMDHRVADPPGVAEPDPA